MLKNKTKLSIIIFLFLALLFAIFSELVLFENNLDFYWNYRFGIQISEGMIPYNDFSMVSTPLFPFIIGFFLKILGKNIITYTIITAMLKVLFASMLSLISIKSIKINEKSMAKLFIVNFIVIFFLTTRYYFEYNYFSILLVSAIVLLEDNDSSKNNIIIGIIAALIALTKQSIGVFVILLVFLNPIIMKKNYKLKIIKERTIGLLIPSVLFIIYLMLTHSLNNFLDYCLLGLFDFNNNKISIFEYVLYMLKNGKFEHVISSLLFIITIFSYTIYRIIKYIHNKDNSNQINKNTIYYSLAAFTIMYPILEKMHIMCALILIVPIIISSIYIKFKNKITIRNISIKHLINILVFLSLFEIAIYPAVRYKDYIKNNPPLNHNYKYLEGATIGNNLKKQMDIIIEFEKEKEKEGIDVIILDSNAIFYHLPQGKYYKNYDLFMVGNFGRNGENKLIDEIKTRKDTIYLVRENLYAYESNIYSQIPKKVIKYTINNLKEIGKIQGFIIYKNE